MGSQAFSIEEQIKRLKSKGMDFENLEEKAKNILLDVGYYTLGFYWHPFYINKKEEKFKPHTTFNRVFRLYEIDFEFRNTVLSYLNRLETNFKTKLVYEVSSYYKNNSVWFADSSIMNPKFKINTIYTDKFKKTNKTIRNHHKKYINDRYAPTWKAFEYFTFGQLVYVYDNLKEVSLKEKISNNYDIESVRLFYNHINTMVFLRNKCSHNGVLFDLRTPKRISILNIAGTNAKNCSSLEGCILVLQNFIKDIASIENQKELTHSFSNYSESIKEIGLFIQK